MIADQDTYGGSESKVLKLFDLLRLIHEVNCATKRQHGKREITLTVSAVPRAIAVYYLRVVCEAPMPYSEGPVARWQPRMLKKSAGSVDYFPDPTLAVTVGLVPSGCTASVWSAQ